MLPVSLIAALVFAVNLWVLSNGLVYDDIAQVLGNRWITDLRFLPDIFASNVAGFEAGYATSYYRPMMHVVYMCCYYLVGLAPWGYHLANVLFHAGVSILVLPIAARLLDREPPEGSNAYFLPSFIAALLFATHPVHAEAVAWVAAVPELAFSFCYLLSFCLYLRATEDDSSCNKPLYLLSLGAFFLATLCKEPALTLPAVLLLHDLALRPAACWKRRVLGYLPYAAVALLYFAVRYQALGGFAPSVKHWNLSDGQYLLNALWLFACYLGKLLLPVNLSIFHSFQPIASIGESAGILSVLVAALYLGALAVAFRKSKEVFFCLAFIALTLLPALYIPALGESPLGERQLYLPSLGFVMLLGLVLSRARGRFLKLAFFTSLAPWLLVATYSAVSFDRNTVWKDEYTLWSDAAEKSPGSATVREYLGYALYTQGRVDEAISQYLTSLYLDPRMLDAHINLGIAYSSKNMTEQAIEQYREALRINPSLAEVHAYLGEALQWQGKLPQALQEFQRALQINPSLARACFDLGVCHWSEGSFELAKGNFEQAAKLDQGNVTYREALAKATANAPGSAATYR
jgi:tetratricopeptide (TPR) repeat protein